MKRGKGCNTQEKRKSTNITTHTLAGQRRASRGRKTTRRAGRVVPKRNFNHLRAFVVIMPKQTSQRHSGARVNKHHPVFPVCFPGGLSSVLKMILLHHHHHYCHRQKTEDPVVKPHVPHYSSLSSSLMLTLGHCADAVCEGTLLPLQDSPNFQDRQILH